MSIFLGKCVFPPAKEHPRTSELLKVDEDYFLGCWPFKSDASRQHFSRSILADFTAKTIPDTEHWEKLVLACRVTTSSFLIDDLLDTDLLYDSKKKFDIIPSLLQVIYGTKKPDPNLYWEVISDDIWRGIQRGCTDTEFDQMTRTAKEWYMTHGRPLPESFDGWLVRRRHNSGANWTYSITRYAMECRITDEELTHPIVREAEDSAAVIFALVNDIVSLPKEKMANCEELNAVTMVRKYGLVSTEEDALAEVSNIVVQSSRKLMESTKRGLADPTLSSEVKRWMVALPYVASGNAWWSQLSSRYNFPGLPAPRMTINIEGKGDIIEPSPSADMEFDKLVDGVPMAKSK
ncbi:isoprenoid synthase domain-containing protein [Rhodocollybia butyracea]|uniref:Terpene synthase n=1 Tax=Rhodocollybia butyracea TaxID=206335 RepID=A0A9P5U6L6_9AGAR|nr:isoprenoid synthase domain-containing protein [Rhodocollybia butyracea]